MSNIRTFVAVTTEEVSPGVPLWGTNQVTTKLPEGETEVALENLVAGKKYYVKTWNEDQFGNRSAELLRVINSTLPFRTMLFNFSAQGVLDSGSPMRAFVKLPPAVIGVESCLVTLSFREFFANAQEAAAIGTQTSVTDGGSTTPSGGGSTSGASSAASSSSDLTGLTFVSNDSGIVNNSGAASAGTAHTHTAGSYATGNVIVSQSGTGNHSHSIPHTHSTPSHSHTTPDHDHDIAGHDHALVYGTFEETYPATHEARVRIYKRSSVGGVWVLITTILHATADLVDYDLTDYITGAGDWRIEVQSEAGEPNDGRLGLDLYGSITVLM